MVKKDLNGDLKFKFHFMVPNPGLAAGTFLRKKGIVGESGLTIWGEYIMYNSLEGAQFVDKHLSLIFKDSTHIPETIRDFSIEAGVMLLKVSGAAPRDVEQAINRNCSKFQTEVRRLQLAGAGQEHTMQVVECPHCNAAIDLTDFGLTQYTFCQFCKTVFTTEQGDILSNGDDYSLCEECGMFDRTKGYDEFYFYFLLVVYGYSQTRRYVCDCCAERIAIKCFFVNFLFVLGVPFAVINYFRSKIGRDPQLKKLAKANGLVMKGDVARAQQLYNELEQKFPRHPGLVYNQAIGWKMAGHRKEARELLEQSLQYCCNYYPILALVEAQRAEPSYV